MTSPSPAPQREVFSSRWVFILAAVGSAVGLGNIWRYPYIAYANGGGAFLVPYLVALVSAGIPLLLLEYGMGHRFRGAAPLAFRRVHRWAEPIGWAQTLIAFIIAVYYAVVLVWAWRYFLASFSLDYAEDPAGYFFGDVLQMSEDSVMFGSLVPGLAIPLVVLWVVVIGILIAGVEKGIGWVNRIVIPLLVVVFIVIVARSLFLPGAAEGLDALFTPHWGALLNPDVWVAAYGQIFFSLSVGFGIMIAYSSYLKRRTNLTGSGLMVGLSNSSFELLAGIGVFACLGFLAQAQGVPVSEAATSGPGLAFVAFPALLSQMPAGNLFGVLFFGSLVLAGLTSLISICQGVAAAFQEKFGLGRKTAIGLVLGVMAALSVALFPTTTGLTVLDTVDHWSNNIALVAVSFVSLVALAWGFKVLPMIQRHLTRYGSIPMIGAWRWALAVVTPLMLLVMLGQVLVSRITEGYEGYPTSLLVWFGWSQLVILPLVGLGLALLPWRRATMLAPALVDADGEWTGPEGDLDADGIPDDKEILRGGDR